MSAMWSRDSRSQKKQLPLGRHGMAWHAKSLCPIHTTHIEANLSQAAIWSLTSSCLAKNQGLSRWAARTLWLGVKHWNMFIKMCKLREIHFWSAKLSLASLLKDARPNRQIWAHDGVVRGRPVWRSQWFSVRYCYNSCYNHVFSTPKNCDVGPLYGWNMVKHIYWENPDCTLKYIPLKHTGHWCLHRTLTCLPTQLVSLRATLAWSGLQLKLQWDMNCTERGYHRYSSPSS